MENRLPEGDIHRDSAFFAILFIMILDIAVVFMVLWGVRIEEIGAGGGSAAVLFLLILSAGVVYGLRGGLDD